jgi:multidrug resistance efflux pump
MAAVAVLLLVDPGRRSGGAQNPGAAPGPLISRGYTGAPAGTVVVPGDPTGGEILIDLRITEGQKVKRDQIIAVLSNFPTADVEVRQAEARLTKAGQQREAMVSGFRTAEIVMQEAVVKSAAEESRLKALELQRSSLPPDQKQLENSISRQTLEREQAKLRVQKQTLATDLAQIDAEIRIIQARLDSARMTREQSLVRAPVDGVVVDIFTRKGERISRNGIAKIVDLSQLRIFADVDELHIPRLTPGSRVEFTFRGSPTVHTGTVVRTPLTVQRSKMSEADFGTQTTRLAEVEIKPDDLSGFPLMLGREARVVFP